MYQVWKKNLITKHKEIVSTHKNREDAIERANQLSWEDAYKEYMFYVEMDGGEE